MNYVAVKAASNDEIDNFVADYKLFAVFDAPANILFASNFDTNVRKYKDIFAKYKHGNNIFFSCKTNKSFYFLKRAAQHKCGIEVSSIYELKDALKFTNKIIASGPAKSDDYINLAIENNVIISVDDIVELKKIIQIQRSVKVFIRINNIIDSIISRFGINMNQIEECLKLLKDTKIKLIGFSFHINNYNLEDRIIAIRKILKLQKEFKLDLQNIDIGGGFPSNYCDKNSFEKFLEKNNSDMFFRGKKFKDFYPYFSDIANEKSLEYILSKTYSELGNVQIITEPGRSLLNNCGISLYRVEYIKKLENGEIIIVTNGNINCLSEQWFNTDYLIEPKLYKRNSNSVKLRQPIYASVAGNLCLEQDMLTWRKIKFDYLPEEGDYLIYYNTAGYQMDSNESTFHKIPLVKKYVVEKNHDHYEIKEDEKYDR